MIPFLSRHLGPSPTELQEMCDFLGFTSPDALIDAVIPPAIRLGEPLALPDPLTEPAALDKLRSIMGRNRVVRSWIGLGFHDSHTPPVIQRNILENPGWYTAYTPYQAEISQGRLEALLNFQTMITDLTGLPVANASLLDEGSACAEAITLCHEPGKESVLVSRDLHPHCLDVIQTRANFAGLTIRLVDPHSLTDSDWAGVSSVIVSYPDTRGLVHDFSNLAAMAHNAGAKLIVAADLLALTLFRAPGEFGADVCVGNSQRFGVPLGFGGPHAAFMAVSDALKRKMPGRLIGVSRDSHGNPALRLSLQTREQHIRREKATSNICTAQVLLAVMASMYAVYHGPEGLRAIAERIRQQTAATVAKLRANGIAIKEGTRFDTFVMEGLQAAPILARAAAEGFNLRGIDDSTIGVSFDECTTDEEITRFLGIMGVFVIDGNLPADAAPIPAPLARTSVYLTHPVFHKHRSETGMMRYLRHLEHRDIALNRSMIPLGSCTMKLNAAAEMMPLSWPEVSRIHPYAPSSQTEGYHAMLSELEHWLARVTGFAAVSLQPNAGSQGEYAGLLAIAGYHASRGETQRDICLIPLSAHGTNPASAVMAGMKVVPVACDSHGNIDHADLERLVVLHSANLAALMITYPSTHGVFEEGVEEICALIHQHGGQVYMDGANMNAQVALTSPGKIGADVCHLNLHKTFCIPHGGGGPGVGPIGVAAHLEPWLPGHALLPRHQGAVCSAPYGSASITTISWMYIAMMGPNGLAEATKTAILNANYMARRLESHFPILYKGRSGLVAHECILDLRSFTSITVEDVAKRLIDFGFHAPTMSWPVSGTLMIEPTESENRSELDRFCEAMIAIHAEIHDIESGTADAKDNPLKNAPHTAASATSDSWPHPYSRESAVYPLAWVREDKYWPPVGRVDNVFGDRNLVCTCPGMESYER